MTASSEPARHALPFTCEKRPATGARGMVVTNHPLASAAGAEMLLSGGNAIDAAVAALFALTVVEPMMVGILGGGVTHLRLPNGRHVVIDALSTAPSAARADMYETTSDGLASARSTVCQKNEIGAASVACRRTAAASRTRPHAALGSIDVVVFAAATAQLRPLHTMSPAEWARTLDTNLIGVNLTIAPPASHTSTHGALVVVMSSESAGRPFYGLGAYAASKSAAEDTFAPGASSSRRSGS